MADAFDPYYTWLGIPPHEQPANHYRLLGISVFESNAEVISNAADRLMLHLRAFQSGKRSKESQQLLNEISSARVCLLNAEKKARYDADLRAAVAAADQAIAAAQSHASLPPPTSVAAPNAPAIVEPPLGNFAVSPRRAGRSTTKARPKSLAGIWLAVASIAVLAAVGGIAVLLATKKGSTPSVVEVGPGSGSDSGSARTTPGPNDAGVKKPPEAIPVTPPPPVVAVSNAQNFTPPDVVPAWHDLLKLVDVSTDRLWGEWQSSSGALQASPMPGIQGRGSPTSASLVLPVVPLGEYRLRIKLSTESPSNAIVILLPVAGRQMAFSVNARFMNQSRSGFEKIDGKRLDQNESWTSAIELQAEQPHVLDLIVLGQAEQVRLFALWDGQPASHWNGDANRLSPLDEFGVAGETAICLGAIDGPARFYAVELGVVSGDVRYRRENVARLAMNVPPPMPPPQPMPTAPSETPRPPATENVTPSRAPDAAAVAEAVKELQSQRAAELAAAKRPDQKLSLVRTLREEAQQAGSNPARQAALWLEAQRLAASAGDVRLALAVIRERTAHFSSDTLAESAELLKNAVYPANLRTENAAVAEAASQLLDQAIAADRFDVAELLAKATGLAYGRIKNVDMVNRLNDRQADVGRMKAEHDKLGPALEKLAASPGDAEANLAVGRYLCFYKNDWQQGLPRLVQGSDAELAAAAKKDLENPTAAAACADLGGLWWDATQKLPATAKRYAHRRAAEWYLLALPKLTGQPRAIAQRRIEQGVPLRGEPTALVNQGLIGYWSFDEGSGRLAQDLTKNRNHALLSGASWTRGISGSALQTKSPNEYAHFLNGTPLNQWTISLWVKFDQIQGSAGLFTVPGTTPRNVHLLLYGDGSVQANIFNSGSSNPKKRLEPGRWHHVLVRYDGNQRRDANSTTTIAVGEVWIDGERDADFRPIKENIPILGPARIGGWYDDNTGNALVGAIDDVRLYGRPLRDDEIAMLFTAWPTEQENK